MWAILGAERGAEGREIYCRFKGRSSGNDFRIDEIAIKYSQFSCFKHQLEI